MPRRARAWPCCRGGAIGALAWWSSVRKPCCVGTEQAGVYSGAASQDRDARPFRWSCVKLIRRMTTENPLWGEERIANELLLKLGVRVSPRTVRKYMPKRPPGRPRGDQGWSTFLRNHANAIVACDFFVAVTAASDCSMSWF